MKNSTFRWLDGILLEAEIEKILIPEKDDTGE